LELEKLVRQPEAMGELGGLPVVTICDHGWYFGAFTRDDFGKILLTGYMFGDTRSVLVVNLCIA
jgi:hypothetical protein